MKLLEWLRECVGYAVWKWRNWRRVQDCHWTGAGGVDFTDRSNWMHGVRPRAGDSIVLPKGDDVPWGGA